jgi:hypothetical protein
LREERFANVGAQRLLGRLAPAGAVDRSLTAPFDVGARSRGALLPGGGVAARAGVLEQEEGTDRSAHCEKEAEEAGLGRGPEHVFVR